MRLHVGNLAPETTEKELQRFFETVGKAVSVRIIKGRQDGAPRGSAFVDMANSKQGERAAHKLDAWDLHERSIQVSESRSGKDRRHQDQRRGQPNNWDGPDRRRGERRRDERREEEV